MSATSVLDAAEALDALAASDPALPGLAVVLDAEALGRAFGEPVRIHRVRYKPGTSVIAAIESSAGRQWVAAYANGDKVRVSTERSRRARLLDGVPFATTGPARTDRALVPAVRDLEKRAPEAMTDAGILRHNPGRRLVLATADRRILKVSAHDVSAAVEAGESLRAAGVPVLPTRRLSAQASDTPLWGRGDLGENRDAAGARLAGAALAAVHAAAVPPTLPVTDARADAEAAVRAVSTLMPQWAHRSRRVAEHAVRARRDDGASAFVHGDFSADQVLVGGHGEIRLIDFDRAGAGDPARDLASFAVDEALRASSARVGAPLISPLLDGYREAGGAAAEEDWRRWVPLAALMRAVEPFRRCDADWPSGIDRALSLAEQELS